MPSTFHPLENRIVVQKMEQVPIELIPGHVDQHNLLFPLFGVLGDADDTRLRRLQQRLERTSLGGNRFEADQESVVKPRLMIDDSKIETKRHVKNRAKRD
jgi:hypothetical protein